MRLNVLLIDDNPLFVVAASRFLSEFCDVNVVAAAGDGVEGLARARELNPDVVMIDQGMSPLTGLDTVVSLRALPAPPAVIIVTLNATPQLRQAARERGCELVISKIDFTRQIGPALEALAAERRPTAVVGSRISVRS